MSKRQETKEKKQLEKFKKMLAKPDYKGYFFVMIGLVILFQLFDGMATGIFGTLQEAVVKDFAGLPFDADIAVGGAGYEKYQNTLSTITLTNLIGYGFMGILPWYKSLADRLGRRPFFVLNSILLGLAMFVGGLTHNLTIFVLVSLVITFFTLHDMQIVYVTECVPDRQRGTWQGIVAAVGSLAGVITTAMRLFSLQEDGTVGEIPWRAIYISVGIFGLVIFGLSAILLRESRPFLVSRVAWLEKSERQRQAQEKAKNVQKIGVIAGIKMICKNKQLRWLSIATLIFSAANNMICSYNNTIMAQNGIDTIGITVALLVSSAVSIVMNLLIGPISDRIGRKLASVIGGIISAVSFAAMVYGSPYIEGNIAGGIFSGITSGLAIFGYIAVMNLTTLMMSESCPSTMRGSIIGVRSFFQVSAVVTMTLSGALFRFFSTGEVCFWLAVPFLLLGSVCLMVKTKETKGLTMEEIDAQFQ